MARKGESSFGIRKWLIVVAGTVVACVLLQIVIPKSLLPSFGNFNVMADPTSTIRPGPLVVQAIQQQARLETVTMTIAGDVNIIREHGVLGACTEELDYLAYYQVSAGVDLAGITQNNIQVVNDGLPSTAVVTLTLPRAQITHNELDTVNSRILKQDTPKWLPGCSHEIADMTLEAQQKLRDYSYSAAMQRGIIPEAEENAKEELQRILGQAGYSKVTIIFTNQVPATPVVVPTVGN